MEEIHAHIAVLWLEFHIPASGSLKSKRRVIKSLKDRIRAKFNASVAEVGELDKWQRSVCGVTMISNDRRYLDECMQKILTLVQFVEGAQLISSSVEFFVREWR